MVVSIGMRPRPSKCSRAVGWFSSSASSRATKYPVSRKTPAPRSITRVEVTVVLGRAVPCAGAHRVLAESRYRIFLRRDLGRRPFPGFSCRGDHQPPGLLEDLDLLRTLTQGSVGHLLGYQQSLFRYLCLNCHGSRPFSNRIP